VNKKYLVYLLDRKGLNLHDMARILEIKKDSLEKKLLGINRWSLRDAEIVIKTVGKTFEEVFLDEEPVNENAAPLIDDDTLITHPLTHKKVRSLRGD